MNFFIPKGTRVTVRRPNANPTDWFQHTLRKDLEFDKPVQSTFRNYVFQFQGWSIRVGRDHVQSKADAA